MSDNREKRQQLAAAYGAGEINQGRIAGEYPAPDVLEEVMTVTPPFQGGTVTGRFTHSEPSFREVRKKEPWPMGYAAGPSKLTIEDVRKLQAITPDQARGIMQTVVGVDWSELERRVLAWQAEMERELEAKGFRRAGDGPLSDSWIKED